MNRPLQCGGTFASELFLYEGDDDGDGGTAAMMRMMMMTMVRMMTLNGHNLICLYVFVVVVAHFSFSLMR